MDFHGRQTSTKAADLKGFSIRQPPLQIELSLVDTRRAHREREFMKQRFAVTAAMLSLLWTAIAAITAQAAEKPAILQGGGPETFVPFTPSLSVTPSEVDGKAVPDIFSTKRGQVAPGTHRVQLYLYFTVDYMEKPYKGWVDVTAKLEPGHVYKGDGKIVKRTVNVWI